MRPRVSTVHWWRCTLLLLALVGSLLPLRSRAQTDEAEQAEQAEFGLSSRIAWNNSALRGFPDPPPPLKLVTAFPNIQLEQLIALSKVPESDWLLAVEHKNGYGGPTRVFQFRDEPQAKATELFLERPEIIYGFAFHPDFAANPFVFVGCNGRSEALDAVATRVLRFKVEGDGPYHCDPASTTVVIEWKSNGHNGGDLAFGNDGMLYVSAGDGTSDSDQDRTGQDLTTLNGSILRIDVDSPEGDQLYSIPRDNPFLGVPSARREIWAYGLRNPWRVTFDRESGQLWVGNNGQDLWESAYLIERGANYGWSINESNHPFHTHQDHGPAEISPSTVEHHHSEARSLTGGHVYRGSQFPELLGAYIYGDYSTGNIWAVRHDGQQVVFHEQIARSGAQITGFGLDSQGEILIADHVGTIYRFEGNSPQSTVNFPRALSHTGLFVDAPQERAEPGLIEYSVNSPLWSDGAIKRRWMAVPENATVDFEPRGAWGFPEGSVLVKSFSFPTALGDLRRVETRLLVKQDGEWYGYSYRWNEAQTDAFLVQAEGSAETLDWVQEVDGPVAVQWTYPSRSDCMVCHSRAAKFVLGVSTEQMNRTHTYSAAPTAKRQAAPVTAPQLATLEHIGLFGNSKKPSAIQDPPKLVDPSDASQDLEQRARSYLHSNCANCHVNAGGGNSRISLDYFAPPEKWMLVDEEPLHTNFGISGARLVAPGAADQSVLFARLARRGEGQMPPLATHRVDPTAVELMRQWISSLPANTR